METIQQAMKRTELAFQAGLPQENKRRKIIVVTIGILVLCGWSLLALYSIVGDRKNDLSFAPEVVYVPQAPAPAAGSGPSFYQSPRRGTLIIIPLRRRLQWVAHHSAYTKPVQPPSTPMAVAEPVAAVVAAVISVTTVVVASATQRSPIAVLSMCPPSATQ